MNYLPVAPKVLYFGTPVVLISTQNEDGTANLAPMSSAWSLGKWLVLGLGTASQSFENLSRTREAVLNFPAPHLWPAVERLAPLTGKNPVPPHKQGQFRYEKDKFAAAQLTPVAAEKVQPPRVDECPLQFETVVRSIQPLGEEGSGAAAIQVEVVKIHAHAEIVQDETHIDTSHWQPLIYNFRHYFGLSAELGKTFRA